MSNDDIVNKYQGQSQRKEVENTLQKEQEAEKNFKTSGSVFSNKNTTYPLTAW